MPIESRSKIVSFRLTEEEYGRFRELCFSQGIRSVSEMARAGLNFMVEQPGRMLECSLESRVSEVEGRIHLLALEVKRLNQSLSQPPVRPALFRAQK